MVMPAVVVVELVVVAAVVRLLGVCDVMLEIVAELVISVVFNVVPAPVVLKTVVTIEVGTLEFAMDVLILVIAAVLVESVVTSDVVGNVPVTVGVVCVPLELLAVIPIVIVVFVIPAVLVSIPVV